MGFKTQLDFIQGGSRRMVAELLNQENGMLEDIPYKECDQGDTNLTEVRTGLSKVYLRALNEGVPSSKGNTSFLRDGTAMLESVCDVDEEQLKLKLGTNASDKMAVAQYLNDQMTEKVEAIAQEHQRLLIYGNAGSDSKSINGLHVRLNDSSAESAQNIFSAGGSTASKQSSIYVVTWGENSIHGLFPTGMQGGIERVASGIDDIYTGTRDTGGTGDQGVASFRGYRERIRLKCGLAAKDWRYFGRILNVDTTKLDDGSVIADLVSGLIALLERIQVVNSRTRIYMNRKVATALRLNQRQQVISGSGITFENITGKRVRMFDDVQVKIVDRILNTEEIVNTTSSVAWNALPSNFDKVKTMS